MEENLGKHEGNRACAIGQSAQVVLGTRNHVPGCVHPLPRPCGLAISDCYELHKHHSSDTVYLQGGILEILVV